MKFRKAAAFVMSLAMLGSTSAITAFAGDTAPKKSYDYVALGDSIAAGYGLRTDATGIDHSIALTKELIADPVAEAYPAVFGSYLEDLGELYGCDVSAVNLSTTGFRAEDVATVLSEEGAVSDMSRFILGGFLGDRTEEILSGYHDIFEEYIPEAELVSIHLGGNDMAMATFVPLLQSKNPILKASGTGLVMVLFGMDLEKVSAAVTAQLEAAKDDITYETITEAFQFFSTMSEQRDQLLLDAAGYVKNIVEIIQEKNPDADIAVINQFNPYITDYDYAEAFCKVIQETFREAIEQCTCHRIDTDDSGKEYETAERYVESEESEEAVEEAVEENRKSLRRLKVLVNAYKERKEALSERRKAEMDALLEKLTKEIGFPFAYTVLNKAFDPHINLINENLAQVCEDTGAIYVDIYGYVTPDLDSDPHPGAIGHMDIADRMMVVLGEQVEAAMENSEEDTRPAPTFEKQSLSLGGEIAVNFYLDLKNLTEEEKEACYVEFTVGDMTSTDTFDADDMNKTKEFYGFTCSVPSVAMADEITAVLHYGKDKTVTKTYSVEQYLNLFNENDSEKLLELIRSINDYGYYAQQYLSRSSASPWTIGVEHQAMAQVFHESYTADEVDEILGKIEDKQIVKNLNTDIAKVNYALSLDSDTTVNLYIKPASKYKGDVTVTIDGVPAEAELQTDGRYEVQITGIAPQHLADMHEVVITTENGTSVVNVSAMSYVYTCLSDPLSKEETNAMASIYRYYAATRAYLGLQ